MIMIRTEHNYLSIYITILFRDQLSLYHVHGYFILILLGQRNDSFTRGSGRFFVWTFYRGKYSCPMDLLQLFFLRMKFPRRACLLFEVVLTKTDGSSPIKCTLIGF